MNSKRGLSEVVSTILIILLILAALAGIWLVVNNFLIQGSTGISLGKIAADVVIDSALVNQSTGIATVKVTRNPGVQDVNVTQLKFIVEDSKNSDVFTVNIPEGLPELATRTYTLNLSASSILNLTDIKTISVAPVYKAGNGADVVSSSSTNSYSLKDQNTTVPTPPQKQCTINADCGNDTWVAGSEFCSASNSQLILQYKTVYQCISGFCSQSTNSYPKSTCVSPDTCFGGQCKSSQIPCTPQNVSSACGTSGYVGFPSCDSSTPSKSIVQNYQNYSCVNNICQTNVTTDTLQNCSGTQICSASTGNPQCFTPVECTQNSDCVLGKICSNGTCIPETAALNGTVASIWPFNLGEYFDSNNLPKVKGTINYVNYNIIFPGSNETRCLKILEFVYPDNPADNSYIRVNSKNTNIKSGNYFEVWQTAYGCTFVSG